MSAAGDYRLPVGTGLARLVYCDTRGRGLGDIRGETVEERTGHLVEQAARAGRALVDI